MLQLCTAQNRCLILTAAHQLNLTSACQQLGLAGFGVAKTLAETVTELLAAKRAANRREVYLKSLAHYLTRFAAGRGQTPLAEISAAKIEVWLAQFASSYSRQTWLNRISTLFAFAVRRGYLAANPCDRVERVTIDHKPPTVLTVAQVRALIAACPTVCKPWLVFALFAGIRPDGELMKLKWGDVNFSTRTAQVNFPKVRKHRRIVPLEPGVRRK